MMPLCAPSTLLMLLLPPLKLLFVVQIHLDQN